MDESAHNRGVQVRVAGLDPESSYALGWEGPVDHRLRMLFEALLVPCKMRLAAGQATCLSGAFSASITRRAPLPFVVAGVNHPVPGGNRRIRVGVAR